MSTFTESLDSATAKAGPKHKHPNGFAPGFTDDGKTITLVAQTKEPQPPEWRDLLKGEGYDPDEFEIDEKGLKISKWQPRPDFEDFNYSYKFTILRSAAHSERESLQEKLEAVVRRPKLQERTTGESDALVVNLADWQAGASHGGGPTELADRIAKIGPAVLKRLTDLRKMGYDPRQLIVHSLGDMGEGCSSVSPMSLYQLQMTDEEQRAFLLEAYDSLIDQWVGRFDQIRIYAVPGNHGEKRRTGEKGGFTDYRDNTDIGVWANLAWMHSKNPGRYSHVSTHLPEGQNLHVTYENQGFITCLIHGHQARGGDCVGAIDKWWQSQMAGMTSAGDANLMVSGHHHHYRMAQQGPRTIMVSPALCGKQDWWMNVKGLDSPAGTLTYMLTATGWSQQEII